MVEPTASDVLLGAMPGADAPAPQPPRAGRTALRDAALLPHAEQREHGGDGVDTYRSCFTLLLDEKYGVFIEIFL